MPLNKNIKKVLVIGSGPIIIGQAAEFDYAGTQACKALKEQGLEVVLINSNPATLMTDASMAHAIYIEPLIPETIKRIILKEKPDSILSTLGGQTGLTLSMQLAKEGFLAKHNVTLLGANPETIDKAEDRQLFKDTMKSIGEPCIPSKVVTTLKDAIEFVDNTIGYPAIIRPAFTLGGTGGGIVNNLSELEEIAKNGLHRSPIHQILVEKCISGWKEIEFEVIRDSNGNVITVCSMENLDPVGVHTGDSIVIAPAVTLADKEYQMLRSAALNIITALKIEGGCNCQFALNPHSFEYTVIEVNPRVSRSSALASKATGYPIAKVATLIAIGFALDEIPNAVTGKTSACFEPSLDYVVVKMPKWPFDKFVYAKRTLGTQMKATGEVMAIGTSFEQALMKAVRGCEIGQDDLNLPTIANAPDAEIDERLHQCTDLRLFVVYEALKRAVFADASILFDNTSAARPDVQQTKGAAATAVKKIHDITNIDTWFLSKLLHIAHVQKAFRAVKTGQAPFTTELYEVAKNRGFTDTVIAKYCSLPLNKAEELTCMHRYPVYKMVDTCAGEFAAITPYFYATYDEHNEAEEFLQNRAHEYKKAGKTPKKRILVLGSGPIRIGQGIEFDYASVQCVWALKKLGYEVAIVNNNPETVSTDFDTADRLYFEPLTPEDIMGIIQVEQPEGVVVAFGGGTAIKLTQFLSKQGIKILGTNADSIDLAEDRDRFEQLLQKLNIKRPKGFSTLTEVGALEIAEKIGYPVLMRPSYVLGGQNMIIAFNANDIHEYMQIILRHSITNPVLIDKYMMGIELEVDAICDGENILIPGIMEHIERTGIHSGDSIAVYPSWNINDIMTEKIIKQSRELALALNIKGLVNIQYLIYENELYIIEVNPRSSRTIPYISKVTGVPMVELATRAMFGEKLIDMGYGIDLYPIAPNFAVKVPVFSFEKLSDVDIHLGPEMKSTGEVLGIARTMDEALYKGLIAAGYKMKKTGGILITVRKNDQFEIVNVARLFYELGFKVYATEGTAAVLADFGMESTIVDKIHENPDNNLLTLLDTQKVDYVISTSAKGRIPTADSVILRRKAVEKDIPCLTSVDTANALALSLKSRFSPETLEIVDCNKLRKTREKFEFTKMESTGNDFIICNGIDYQIHSPEALTVRLCQRRTSIGADSLVIVENSTKADAKMRIFNLDGTESPVAGNALRCVAKYIFDTNIKGIADVYGKSYHTADITVETKEGIKQLTVYKSAGTVTSVSANMGTPLFEPKQIPAKLTSHPLPSAVTDNPKNSELPTHAIVGVPITVKNVDYTATVLSMGNPHCVVFCGFVDKLDLAVLGPKFEFHKKFPERVNTEFVRIIDRTTIKMRAWERSNGETPACGTGACAAVVAAVLNGNCPLDEDITVRVPGGELTVRYTNNGVILTGPVTKVFEGTIEV
ncbi:MAG TPA: carbamoyl-phosphate synthase large subunit [Treponemataceae bacterium]|nr:carbamoyl-phosphate synthase large subunit [Treponemataceae bacterium]